VCRAKILSGQIKELKNIKPMKTNKYLHAALVGLALTSSAHAGLSFLGVAAGDASSINAVLWTRAVDTNAPAETALTAQVSTDVTFGSGVSSYPVSTVATNDYTAKVVATGLTPGVKYFYRFTDGTSNSLTGTFKTAPAANAAAAVSFAFSGDCDGLIRPYALASQVPNKNLDFFMFDGDTIYETASSGSAAVTSSGNLPAPSSTGATSTQLFNDYSRKYREQFLPVNVGGQNCLQPFFAGQGNYTTYDNHELGNKQYINGGAPAGTAVGDFSTGAGVDARVASNDTNFNASSSGYMNRSGGFQTLQQVFMNYQPIKERGNIVAPSDPRMDGTRQLYFAQQWGKNALFVNTDCRSYRDIRMKTSANADDTGSRADNASRTYLGATQLAWLENTLLAAQQAGTTWKFINISDPIDQLGPIGGALSLSGLPSFGAGSTYAPVSADGGKAWFGGYRAERNALLKFIADNQIRNVVFLATDDHQNRINELSYSTNGVTGTQTTYAKVPYCFQVVCGPLGATGPDLITVHDFAALTKPLADSIANAQIAAGIDPIGLATNYPGLHNVTRLGDSLADTLRQPADFYSPDTFNYNKFDVSADGKTLTVTSYGINSTAQNSFAEYNASTNAEQQIFSFQIDAADPINYIDHFIVVYQENWSFDALYGSFPGANGINGQSQSMFAGTTQIDRIGGAPLSGLAAANGFNRYTGSGLETVGNTVGTPGYLNIPPQPIRYNNGNGSTAFVDTRFSSNPADATSPTLVNTLLPYDVSAYVSPTNQTGDIVHRYWQEQFQITGADVLGTDHGNNSGFVTWSDNPGLVMSHFDATSLPEGQLAQQYTMCDNFFHSSFGGSFLNHQFLIAAAAPVYNNMPGYDPVSGWAGNSGALAYLDTNGLVIANASGLDTSGNPAVGKLIRDGSITPVVGDTMIGLRINGTSNLSATVSAAAVPSDVVFWDSTGNTHFDKHYVVNTSFSRSLATSTTTFATNATGNLDSTSFNVTSASGTLLSANNVGMTVTGTGIPAGTVVTSVSGSTIGLSKKPTVTQTGAVLTFSGFPLSLIPLQDNSVTQLNIGDRLDTASVSWKWYSGGWSNALASSPSNPLHFGSAGPNTVDPLFQWHHQPFAFFAKSAPFDYTGTYLDGRNPYATAHLQDEAQFYTDITSNTLPQVSFVKFLGPDNEHPGYASLQQGQLHVSNLVAQVQANPALWAHTAIIITYDEHGGRWDHVTPPARDQWGPGVRVPCIIISPYAKTNHVEHTQYDTTAILATIEHRFGVTPLNSLDANSPTLLNALNTTVSDPATPPALAANRNGNSLALSWSGAYLTYQLQSNTNLTNPAGWVNVTGVSNNAATVLIDGSNTSVFYRLIKQ
jgi:phosphodiesterase/alkaline phosphatase D-like protein/phospholipase C